jgi:hypothetical protein
MNIRYEENNNIYIIELNKIEENNKIIIQIINESNLSEKYISEFSLEYFRGLSDIFKNKTLSEMEKILKNLLDNKKYKLLFIKNVIKIEFYIEIPFVDTIKILLEVSKENLFSDIQLKKLISPLEDKISLLNDKIKILEEKNEVIINKLNILKEENKKLKNNENNNYIFKGKSSKIVISNEEINFLKEIIPNKNFSFLYRATIDGDSFKTFHSKVDGKAPTIILIKTSKDKKWGAYTNNPWSSTGGCDDHPNAVFFLFSISNKKKYIRKEGVSRSVCGRDKIRFCDTIGISSGSSILANNAGEEDAGNSSRYENYINDYEITGSNSFTCVEVEVYEVVSIC